MKKAIILMWVIVCIFVSGCSGSGRGSSSVFAQIEQFIGDFTVKNDNYTYTFNQEFTKKEKQNIILIIREKATLFNKVTIRYSKYGTYGIFNEKLTGFMDKTEYEASLFIGDIQTKWITLTKNI